MKPRTAIAFLALALCGGSGPRAQEDDGVRLLLGRAERIVRAGDTAGFVALLAASADRTRASRPGVSTSSEPATPGPIASGASLTRSGCHRSKTSTACR